MSPPTLTDFRVGQNLAREARQISPPRRHSGSVARTDGVGGLGESVAVASAADPVTSTPSVPKQPTRLDIEIGMRLRRQGAQKFVDNFTAKGPLAMIDRMAPCADLAAFDDRFVDPHGGPNSVPGDIAQLCAGCPVHDECLDFAVRNDAYGIWAGTTRSQRLRMRREAAA